MSKILGMIGSVFAYFCIATVLAVGISIGSMWSSGVLNKDKIYGMLAVVHGIELGKDTADEKADKMPSEQLSLESISDARILHGLNIDIRETAMDKGLVHLRKVGQTVRTDKERFNRLHTGFTQQLKELDGVASDEALQDLKKTLEALPPELARDQIKIILEKEGGLDQIVAVVKAMQIDKRKKLLTAFEGPDGNSLADILEQIRLGTVKRELIKNTAEQLNDPSQK
jgi:hypothetical protein